MIHDSLIDLVTKRLVQVYDPFEIYIFGSYVWGSPDEESDLDCYLRGIDYYICHLG